jgi:predicted DNA-binding antitoxin AbrB/MazE fold protein
MTTPIRAVYQDGRLRPLGPVDLEEGQQVDLLILRSERERAVVALGDLVVQLPDTGDIDVDEEALLREITEAYRDAPPVSDAIIEERREGP